MTTEATPTTVAELAAMVAEDIRHLGHHQTGDHTTPSKDGPCCLLVGPTISPIVDRALAGRQSHEINRETDLYWQYRRALQQVSGHQSIVVWSDLTPTDEVLAVLDRLAASDA